jgi:DNA-binding MarR family transcriptional regulator
MSREELEHAVRRGLRQFDGELDVLEQVVATRLGLSRTDGRALEIIDRRHGISPGELARDLGFTPSAITVAINRLQDAGLVSRSISGEDRRRVLIETTDRGHELVAGFMKEFGGLVTGVLKQMSDEDLAAVERFLSRCSATAAEYRLRVRAGDD